MIWVSFFVFANGFSTFPASAEVPQSCIKGNSEAPPSSVYFGAQQDRDKRPECVVPELGFDVGMAPFVKTAEFMISNPTRHSHIISSAFGPCVGLTLYDPVTKTGMLAHIPPVFLEMNFVEDDHNTVHLNHLKGDFFRKIAGRFLALGIPVGRLQAKLYGGNTTRIHTTEAVRILLAKVGVNDFQSFNMAEGEIGSVAWRTKIFDLNTGETANFSFEPYYPLFDVSGGKDRMGDFTHLRKSPGSL